MDDEVLKELWKIRFEKLLKLEKDSAGMYEQLLDQYPDLLSESGLDQILKQIIKDEKKHIKVAEELFQLASLL